MLSVSDTALLLQLLDDDRPLETLVSEFSSKFPRQQFLHLGSSLIMLLQDKRVLNQQQRLVAFYILDGLFHQEKAVNPFLSFFIDVASDDTADKIERAFVHQLLGLANDNNIKQEIGSQNAAQYLKNFDPSAHTLLNCEELQKQYSEYLPRHGRLALIMLQHGTQSGIQMFLMDAIQMLELDEPNATG